MSSLYQSFVLKYWNYSVLLCPCMQNSKKLPNLASYCLHLWTELLRSVSLFHESSIFFSQKYSFWGVEIQFLEFSELACLDIMFRETEGSSLTGVISKYSPYNNCQLLTIQIEIRWTTPSHNVKKNPVRSNILILILYPFSETQMRSREQQPICHGIQMGPESLP